MLYLAQLNLSGLYNYHTTASDRVHAGFMKVLSVDLLLPISEIHLIGLLTILTHLGELRDLHVEVFTVRLILNLFVINRLQNFPLFRPEPSESCL